MANNYDQNYNQKSDFLDAYGGYAQGTPNQPQFGGSKSSGSNGIIDAFSAGDPVFGSLFGGSDKPKKPATGRREYWKGNAMLNTYNWLLPRTAETVQKGADVFGDIYRRQASKARAYELEQFEDYAPLFSQAILNADPRQAKALERLNTSALGGMDRREAYSDRLQGQLDNPFDQSIYRDITQASLGQSAMQGFGNQPRDAAMAYLQSGLQGNQLQQQREQTYMQSLSGLNEGLQGIQGAVGANKSVLGDPFLAFTGRSAQPQGSNPQSPDYGGFNNDMFSYSVNSDIQRANMGAANSASNKAMIGQIIGGLLGGAGGMAACWIAREVYGQDNPTWIVFRLWLFTRAPRWFLAWYLKNGEEYAAHLANRPVEKKMWRIWMDQKIKELR